ncbi:glycosyltransferase [Aquabacterium sp. NJ1]|uniref:glycosyltransferase n=1 Tax=Aquabacterium sp. NJ1 TaxID=1538295 RepID=UPI001376B8FC|nr:glycosyltransferase [Aquabacterium sp. NJ1]
MLPVPHDQTRGRYIHETARALSKLATVKVFFQQSRYPKLPFVAPRSFLDGQVGPDYRIDGIDVETFTYPVFPLISRAINGHVSSHLLTPRVAAFKPDVVLAYWVYPDGYAALRTARKLGVPCVVGALGSDIHVRSGINEHMTRHTIAGVDALLTVSEAMRQTAIHEFGAPAEQVHTIVNGFNTSVFHPRDQQAIRQRLGIPLDEQVIIYVGRFVEAKGMRELIQAFQAMARTNSKLSLALIGDGVMKAELHSLIEQAGLQGRVRVPGGQPPEQVAEWICAADVLTLPSWSEGYPNVVVEGLACGRPVVATDVGGTREILNEHNGILIPPKQADILQNALEKALRTHWDRAAIAQAMQRTWDDVAQETLKVCQDVARL